MKHIMTTFFQLVFWAMVFAMCDNPNGRDLWDAAIDYADSQGKWCPPQPITIRRDSEIK